MSFSKKYYLGINVTAGHITEQLTQEELLPKNYHFQTCNDLESLNTQVGILKNQDMFCGAIVTIDEISFPLEQAYISQTSKLNKDDVFVLLIEK
jgi:hypothetical protein